MPNTTELADVKRTLLEKYLHGKRPASTTSVENTLPTLKAEVALERESVIAIQTGETKRPFFFLHGDWINRAYWCFPLARALGADQPFYALEPYNFDGLPIPPSIENIAAAHLRSMRRIQPEGPYLLGGFCNGGLLAYEMARQLHAEGQKLDLLVLMDPMPMGSYYPVLHRWVRSILSKVGKFTPLRQEQQMYIYITLQHISSYLRLSQYREAKDLPWLDSKRFEDESRWSKKGFVLQRLAYLFLSVDALRQHYPAIYDWTALLYRPPGPYPGKITFFWPREESRNRKGWRKAVRSNEIETHFIPGTQMESRTQYLHVLAEQLHICLSEVQGK